MTVDSGVSYLVGLLFLLTVTHISATIQRNNRSCTEDVDCLPLHSICEPDKFCNCKDGFVAINRTRFNNFQCVKVAKEEGDLCVHDLQCEVLLGKRAGCISFNESNPEVGECHCLPNNHKVRGLCYATARMGDYCRVSDECYLERKDILAYCELGVCTCPPGFHPSADRRECIENEGVQGPCHDNDDCKYEHTYCTVYGCACEEPYVVAADKMSCEIPRIRLGDRCINSSQCNSYMKETACHPTTRTCVCNVGAHQVNNSCYRISRLGDKCQDRLECVIPSAARRVDCIGNICTCNNYYMAMEHDCLTLSEASLRHSAPNSSSKHHEHLLETLIGCLLLHLMIYSTKSQMGVLS